MPQNTYIYKLTVPVPEDVRYVKIPRKITVIRESAFRDRSNLQSVTIPDSVTEIGDYAFTNCFALQSVTVPDSVTKIGDGIFRDCIGLRSVTMPDRITEIGKGIFYGCSDLQVIKIPNGVTKISNETFSYCARLRSIIIPDGVTEISSRAFYGCSGLRSVTIPNSVTAIASNAFRGCSGLQSLTYKGINIAPFIRIDGHGVNTFDVIKALIEHRIPLSENIIRQGIDAAHQNRLARWTQEYPVFGEMRLPAAVKQVSGREKERLQKCFAGQKRTGGRIPGILDELAITVRTCGIPPERLAGTFDVKYTGELIDRKAPIVPTTACRCYYDRSTCEMLIRKSKISVMAEAINLYNRTGHQECYRHLMDFILSHPDTGIEDLQYAVDHAKEIPMGTDTTLAQVRRHRTYTENLAEVNKIETKYGQAVPGFSLADYPCSIEQVSITYGGMTARVLDLSDDRDIALAAGLGELTNCCQSLGKAGETAMMHGFLNPDAGFWVIEDKDGNIKAQAEIWKTNNGDLVFDNIEFANTDKEHLTDRAEHLRGVIAAWAAESGYRNIVMGCRHNELGTGAMERVPIPELRLTPGEVFTLQKSNVFENVDEVRRYMQTAIYDPNDFVYTNTDKRCVYIKKDGAVSDYLMEGYDRSLINTPGPGKTEQSHHRSPDNQKGR